MARHKRFVVGKREVGNARPPFMVAEMSANHLGELDKALRLIEVAKECGADAIKLQTYTADTITLDHDGPEFCIHGGLWDGRRLHELYDEAHTPWSWHPALFGKARELGLEVFSTPFDATAVELLRGFDAPAYKIASFELVDLPLIRTVAATGKPMIMSTGMANLGEIEAAVAAARAAGCRDLCLLHCVSGYPTPVSESRLRCIPHLSETFGVPVGLSDHTLGISVPVAAVARGACLIEKHFTLARADGGPDAAFSLEPDEFAAMVQACREAWEALGEVAYTRTPSEERSVLFRRSLYVSAPIAEGEVLTAANVRSVRPANGLPPSEFERVLGKRARRALQPGTPLSWDLVE